MGGDVLRALKLEGFAVVHRTDRMPQFAVALGIEGMDGRQERGFERADEALQVLCRLTLPGGSQRCCPTSPNKESSASPQNGEQMAAQRQIAWILPALGVPTMIWQVPQWLFNSELTRRAFQKRTGRVLERGRRHGAFWLVHSKGAPCAPRRRLLPSL